MNKYSKNNKYDFIWNITLVCPWNCEFCCTDSVHVTKEKNDIILYEKGLSEKIYANCNPESYKETEEYKRIISDGFKVTKYDISLKDRQRRGKEISFDNKLSLLNNLKGSNVEIDFAGGDPLSCYENFLIIKKASDLFGKNNISITSTGFSINRYGVNFLSKTIGEFEFTLDETSDTPPFNRPSGYNASNLLYAKEFANNGVRTKAQLPIHSGNFSYKSIESIYLSLAESGIDELLLMRTFPVGRGRIFLLKNGMYIADDYKKVIETYRELESKYSGPKVRLQCALKNLEPEKLNKNPCDLMRDSYGINPRGNLLLSAWATNNVGEPLSKDFVLGNLHEVQFKDLLKTPKALKYFKKLDDNFGHCKIFSYIFSANQTAGSIFKNNDPLYRKVKNS